VLSTPFRRLAKQGGNRDIECGHHPLDHINGRIAPTAFEVVLISPVNTDESGKLILRKTTLST